MAFGNSNVLFDLRNSESYHLICFSCLYLRKAEGEDYRMKFLLFGTGACYERYKKWFCTEDVVALLDNSSEKQNTLIDGIKVLSPENGIKLEYDKIIIMSFYVKEMKTQLLKLGVREERIGHFNDLHYLLYKKELKKPIQYYGNAKELLENQNVSGKRVLLLSQELTLGGPAIALFHVAEVLIKNGYEVIFASMLDGPLKALLLDAHISVVVDVNLQIEKMTDVEWLDSFSLVVCNTMNYYVFLSERKKDIPCIWWLHDSAFFYDGIDKTVLRNIDRNNLKVISVGKVPRNVIQTFVPEIPVQDLLYGVRDVANSQKEMPNDYHEKVCFVTIGYIEERKGQDILIEAIKKLPVELREKAVFYLVGQNTSVMAQKIKVELENLPEVRMTGTVNRDEINRILSGADALICPSREDPMPTVATEAMMHSVPCIVSDVAGTEKYISDGENGFVFQSGNVEELAEKIIWCICHREELTAIGSSARKIYDNEFSMDVFERNVLNVVEEMLP